MYRKKPATKTTLKINESVIGETLPRRIERALNNGEGISDEAHITYTDRKDGVIPDYNIRTDRMDMAREAGDKVSAYNLARREMQLGIRTYDSMTPDQQKAFTTKYPHAKIPQGKKGGEGAA